MNKLKLTFFASVVALATIFSACTTDPIEPIAPTLSVELTANVGANQDSIPVDSFFSVMVTANKGTNPLKSIEVRENGSAISDLTRLDFNGFPAGSNPSPVSDTASIDWLLKIKAPSTEGSNDYTIVIRDQIDSTIERSFSVTAFIPFTAVDTNTMILRLSNRSGPAGQGGLDLDTGKETGTVGVNDTIHDLQDMGNVSTTSQTWVQKFTFANGAVLKKIDNAFDFDAVQYKEEVAEAFANGTDITDQTDVVQVGDKFAVQTAGGTIFLLYTAEVKITPFIQDPNPGWEDNNKDFYRFNAKF